ncbi:MAG: IS21-like element helper ATPase IstB [Limisphaerales bacterium]
MSYERHRNPTQRTAQCLAAADRAGTLCGPGQRSGPETVDACGLSGSSHRWRSPAPAGVGHSAPHAAARFPCIKTLDQFDWNWPKKINRTQVQNLFRLAFLPEKANVVFMGGVGLGKSHLASALGYAACLAGHSVLFTTAVDIINTLTAAKAAYRLKAELKRLLAPRILCVDEVGYLPIDKTGADLLFQVISQRYERGSIVLTTNQPYKHWAKIFNNDSTLTSAVLDRLLHHADTVVIEGKSFRMKDQIEAP